MKLLIVSNSIAQCAHFRISPLMILTPHRKSTGYLSSLFSPPLGPFLTYSSWHLIDRTICVPMMKLHDAAIWRRIKPLPQKVARWRKESIYASGLEEETLFHTIFHGDQAMAFLRPASTLPLLLVRNAALCYPFLQSFDRWLDRFGGRKMCNIPSLESHP